jgi:hypothetical protein
MPSSIIEVVFPIAVVPKSGVKFIVFLQIGPKMTFAPKIYAAVDQILQK